LQRCWPERFASPDWQEQLRALIPGWGTDLGAGGADPEALASLRRRSNGALGLEPPAA